MKQPIQLAILLPAHTSLVPILASHYDRFSGDSRPTHESAKLHDVTLQGFCFRAHRIRTIFFSYDPTLTDHSLVHPEGGLGYKHDQVVSDYHISEYIQGIGSQIATRCSKLGFWDITIFLKHKDSAIQYYVADHSSETLIWINGQQPAGLGGLAESRARNILHEEYWAHMEAFPGARPVSSKAIMKLKSVLSSLGIDSATSEGSTSPFSYEQVGEFLRLLESFRGSEVDQYQTYAVARLWNMVWHARTINNFASRNACLDRFTTLVDTPLKFTGVNAVLAMAMFGATEANLLRCSRTWTGRVAYVSEWRNFKIKNETSWRRIVELACVILIASLLLARRFSSETAVTVPTVLALSAAGYGHYLLTESQNLGDHAADASTYFQYWEKPGYNVQRIALRNSIPQALLTWAFIALLCSTLSVLLL